MSQPYAHLYRALQDNSGALVTTSTEVRVHVPGTSTLIPESLFADDSGTPLNNPFTITSGIIDFYLALPRRVDLELAVGIDTPVTYADIDVVTPSGTLTLKDSGGATWYVTVDSTGHLVTSTTP